MATISIERNTAVKSIVVRFCANAFIKDRQNRKLRVWFCVFTHPRSRPMSPYGFIAKICEILALLFNYPHSQEISL
jgi:hypothetical protein